MAYTRVTNTRNGAAAIRYAYEEKSHKEGMERVLMASGSNLDPQFAMMQMRDTWKAYGKTDGKAVQMYRIVQSFGLDELDPNNQDDIEKANAIGKEFAKEMYPDRQALIVTQADGKGGKLHNHVLVNSISFVNGRALRYEPYTVTAGGRTYEVGSKEFPDIAEKTNEVIQRYGLKPLDTEATRKRRTDQEKRMAKSGKYVFKDDLRERIEAGLQDTSVTSQEAFVEHMRDVHGVGVAYRGKYITYSFEDADGKERKSRDNKLGTDYGQKSVAERFEANKAAQQKSMAGEFDVGAELTAMLGSRKRKPRPKKQHVEITEDVRRTMDELQQKREEEALQEQLRREREEQSRIEEEQRQKAEREAEKARQERERLEREERERKAENARQLQLQREQAIQRIRDATTPRKKVTLEFADRFLESAKELEGKMHNTVTGEKVPYNDFDIYRHTNMKIADEKRQKQASQQAVAEHVAENAEPEL